ncbi:MAG: hypothetical protein ACJ72N_14130 [Labedaea sp.]
MITTADFEAIAEVIDRTAKLGGESVPLDSIAQFSCLFATRPADLGEAVEAFVALWAERQPQAMQATQ